MQQYVAYVRVSTEGQGRSQLGIDAQKRAILTFINGNAQVLEWIKEVESGGDNTRPALRRALERCAMTGASLVVSTLDRLTRDVGFLEEVKRFCEKYNFRFCCADMPDASSFLLGIMAQVAQYERERISHRTKVALQSAKERGVKLGNPNGFALADCAAGRARGTASMRARADDAAELRREIVTELINLGLSNSAIARRLNDRGVRTTSGRGEWNATAVRRLRERLAI